MAQLLVDLLWRDHPAAPHGGTRGPRSRQSTGGVVARAVELADASGIDAVTIRPLAGSLGMSAMSVYTHVNSRSDLLVLMADLVQAQRPLPAFGRSGWRTRVRRVAESNLELARHHPWLPGLSDARTALGPGTIATYDHELHAFDGTGLGGVERDAALTFVVDYVRSAAASMLGSQPPEEFAGVWGESAGRLAAYLGEDHPLAQEVGQAAGESMGGPYDAGRAWEFGLARVIAGLADLIEP